MPLKSAIKCIRKGGRIIPIKVGKVDKAISRAESSMRAAAHGSSLSKFKRESKKVARLKSFAQKKSLSGRASSLGRSASASFHKHKPKTIVEYGVAGAGLGVGAALLSKPKKKKRM